MKGKGFAGAKLENTRKKESGLYSSLNDDNDDK